MKRLSLTLALLLAGSPLAFAQDAPAAAPVERQRDYAAAIRGAREIALGLLAASAPGVSAAVAVDGEIVWSEAFGFADVERGIPVLTTTRFRVGSIAKPYTAAGLALLVEEGRLDLDAPVQTYVESFPVKEEGAITTRLVAGHLSGIRHYKGFEFALNRPFDSVTDGLKIFQDDDLVAPPGEKYSYSTYGWTLIAAAMETASGEEFLAFMDDRVFRPLGMHCTTADRADVVIPGRTTYYSLSRKSGELAVCPPVNNSYKWAGGGFLSTAEDMVRFGSAHLEPGFLKPDTLELVFTPQTTKAGEETNVGLAWFVAGDGAGGRRYSHTGGSMGGTTALAVHPDTRVVAALTTNRSRGPVALEHAVALIKLFEGE